MKKSILLFIGVFTAVVVFSQTNGGSATTENVIVIKEDNKFAGWPANYGIWSWENEIVTGFFLGEHDDERKTGHPIKKGVPNLIRQARSADGGKTWTIEKPSFLGSGETERTPSEHTGKIDFTHKDFALLVRFEGANKGFSSFYYSYDRCKTWTGPYKLPAFNHTGIFGRTDYIVNGKNDMHLFLTGAKNNGGEGWPLAVRTTDGGKTWKLLGHIGAHPDDSSFAIMTSTIRLKNNSLLSVVRRKGLTENSPRRFWMESFLSPDNGSSWYLLDEPTINNGGNPPSMIRMKDGRIALTYGSRELPYGIRAKISDDEGLTWSEEYILRNDGNSWDLGYPRTVQRKDGKLVTVYYFNVSGSKERHIAATIWDPGVSISKK